MISDRNGCVQVRELGLGKAGELFFKVLFGQHPEALPMFSKFSSLMDYEESEPFKEHAVTVMTTIDKALSLLGDLGTL